jgi:thiopurine S-methyltransferase
MTLSPKDRDGWGARWREGRIQFHVDKVNPILGRYVDRLLPEKFGRVFVPLCGKSLDLCWLVEQGHEVVAVELVEKAVEDLFNGIGGSPTISTQGEFQSWQSNGLEVLVGDLFELDANVCGKFDAIWDRAAFVALRPSDRDRYAPHLQEFLRPNGRILLSTISYDGSEMEGPPFSVSANEVHRSFGNSLSVKKLEESINTDPNQCFTEYGIDRVLEEVWLIS